MQRNEHNLMRDFEDEIPGYLFNHELCRVLEDIDLKNGMSNIYDNIISCYKALVSKKVFKSEELKLVDSWIHDIIDLQ